MANYHPDRFLSYTFLTPYVPSGPFDVNAINAASLKNLGYTALGYWPFFNSSDSGPIIDSHKTQFADLLYPKNMSIWKEHFAPIGSTQAWLQNGSDVAHAPYVTDQVGTMFPHLRYSGCFIFPRTKDQDRFANLRKYV